MKFIPITAKAENDTVVLYIASRAPRIRILRETVAEETFTTCEPEREPVAAEVIFEGTPEQPSAGRYRVCDTHCRVNGLYYYWLVELENGSEQLCHPVLVRVRNTNVWWPRQKYRAYMHAIAADFPHMAEVLPCGRTTRGYPLEFLWVGNRENTVLYLGAVHPGESGPEIFLSSVRRLLEIQPELFEKTGVAILPAVSADLREDEVEGCPHYLRTNANGVDINRNFPAEWDIVSDAYGLHTDFFLDTVYRGFEPFSEAETRAVRTLFEQVKPRIAFSGHWMAGICEDHLLTSSAAQQNPAFDDCANRVRDAFCAGFDSVLGGPLSEEERSVHYYCCGGSFPTWCYYNHVIAFDLEGGHRTQLAATETDGTTEELLELGIRCHTQSMCNILRMAAEENAFIW